MKWSTLIGACVGGTAIVAAAIAVQLWSLDTGTPMDENGVDSARKDDVVVSSPIPAAKMVSAEPDPSSSSNRREKLDHHSVNPSVGARDSVEDEGDLSSLPQPGSSTTTRQTESTVRVRGDIGDLTFEHGSSKTVSPPRSGATSVTVASDNGTIFELASSSGQPVVVSRNLDDGIYKWRAVQKPKLDSRVREQLSAARRAGDVEKQRELVKKFREQGLFPTEEEIQNNVQTGTFRVSGGQLVDSSTGETDADEVAVQ